MTSPPFLAPFSSPLPLADARTNAIQARGNDNILATALNNLGFASVKAFGAKGDGVTDDTNAIQAALTATAGVAPLFLPAGTYVVSTLNVPSTTYLYGDGVASILFQKAGANGVRPLVLSGVSNVTVRDLQINGNGNAQAVGEQCHGVFCHNVTDVVVERLTVHDMQGDCIYFESGSSAIETQRLQVVGCTMYNLGRQGITLAGFGCRNVTVRRTFCRTGTRVTTSTSHGNAFHAELDTDSGSLVSGITVEGNSFDDTGISMSGRWTNVVIVGNTLQGINFSQAAIWLINIGQTVIANNVIVGDNSTVLDGIFIEDSGVSSSPTVNDIAIVGNVIQQVAGHGIEVLGTGGGVPSVARVTIANNLLDTIGTGGTKQGIFIATAFPRIVIGNNLIYSPTGAGIDVTDCVGFQVTGNAVYECGGAVGITCLVNSATLGPGLVSGNRVVWASPSGKTGVSISNSASATRITLINNDLGSTAIPFSIGASAVKCAAFSNVTGDVAMTGSFTLAAAATTTVAQVGVTSVARIILVPRNAAAATLMGGANALYVSALTAQASFTVATASGAAAAGTEQFDYWIDT